MNFSSLAYENFFELISNDPDILVITVTDRMQRHFLENYLKYLNNNKAIRSPFISFGLLKNKLWNYLNLDLELDYKILNQHQQQYIWDGLLSSHSICSQILYPHQFLKQLLQAWQYMAQWQGDFDFSDWFLQKLVTDQIQVFIDLSNLFIKKCEQENWLSSSKVLSVILDCLKNNKFNKNILDAILAKKIYWVGFEKTTPEVNDFIQNLKDKNYICEHIWPLNYDISLNHKVNAFECLDPEDEIYQILNWVMQNQSLYKNIGVIIPNLSSRRDELISSINNIKYKQDIINNYEKNNYSFPKYAITGGQKLSEYPVIRDLLDLLYIPISQDKDKFRVLLSCAYLKNSCDKFSDRDKLEWELQQDISISNNINIKLLINYWDDFRLKNNYQDDDLLFSLLEHKNWLSDVFWHKNKLDVSQWLEKLYKFLEILGWPGDHVLSSTDHQVIAKFYDILQNISMYELVASSLSYSDFLKMLQEQISSCLFQPESVENPKVTFFELLEADAIAFDALWIAGINDDIWPPKAKPNPFIPIIYQKQIKMPHSSSERELDFALHIWHRLLKQSPVIMLSCVISDEKGLDKSPSELIRAYGLNKASFCNSSEFIFNKDYYFIFNKYLAKKLEHISNNNVLLSDVIDINPDILSDHNIRELSHGADIIQHQIDCPFKAFARYRLNIKPFKEPAEHLTASDRGQILHEILADFWSEIKNKNNLDNKNLDKNKLDNIIIKYINKSLNKWKIKYKNILFKGMLNIELKRLYNLIISWLEVEQDRPLFEVVGIEKVIKGEIAGMPILARIDRLDNISGSNQKIIVDYKTGVSKTSSWLGDRPNMMQMPLYALLHPNTGAIVFALVNNDNLTYQGVSDKELNISGVKVVNEKNLSRISYYLNKNNLDKNWDDLLNKWQNIAQDAVLDFKNSKTNVDPANINQTCQYCEYKRLCRI